MHVQSRDDLRKRNALLATALTLIALTFLFYPGTDGMAWMMWRDTTWLATLLAATGIACVVLWWRTPRS